MYNEQLEGLIDAALADGVLTEKEKQILFKKAQAMGVDLDEFEMVLDARLVKLQKAEQEKAATSAPKSNKLGDVKKCPACGAIVQSYQGVCPECGYAFENLEVNSSAKKFAELIDKVMVENHNLQQKAGMTPYDLEKEKKQRMVHAIQNFPIPTTKSDLFEFISSLQQKTQGKYGKAYKAKLEECNTKAKSLFANDKTFNDLIDGYYAAKKERSKKNMLLYGGGVGIVIVAILLIIFWPTPTRKSLEKTSVAIEKALKKGKVDNAINLFLQYEGKGDEVGKDELVKNGTVLSLVNACLADNKVDDAIRIGVAAEMQFGYWRDFESAPANAIYKYCISNGDFENAKTVYQTAYRQGLQYHGTYIKDVCIYLCENGNVKEAQKFLNAHKGDIHKNDDKLGKPNEVVNMIQNIINSYK